MSFISEILGNVASGGLLGLFGSLATGWMELKKFDRETVRIRDQHEHEQGMAKLGADVAMEAGKAAAFTASQTSAAADSAASGVAPWAATLRAATRPLLTWLLVAIAAVIAIYAPAEQQARAASELVGLAGMAVGWWFGSRATLRFTKE